jgi:hypothetical protein
MQQSASLPSDSDSATTFFCAENMPLGIQSYDLRLGVTFFGLRFRDYIFLCWKYAAWNTVLWFKTRRHFLRTQIPPPLPSFWMICVLAAFWRKLWSSPCGVHIHMRVTVIWHVCIMCSREYIRCLLRISTLYIRMIHILKHACVRVCACDGIQTSFKHSPDIFSVIMKGERLSIKKLYTCIYIYVYTYTHTHTYIYMGHSNVLPPKKRSTQEKEVVTIFVFPTQERNPL